MGNALASGSEVPGIYTEMSERQDPTNGTLPYFNSDVRLLSTYQKTAVPIGRLFLCERLFLNMCMGNPLGHFVAGQRDPGKARSVLAPGLAWWCGHGDLNPNASLHENLNLACLPIPSCPLKVFQFILSRAAAVVNEKPGAMAGGDGQIVQSRTAQFNKGVRPKILA